MTQPTDDDQHPALPRHTTDAEIGDAMTKQAALHRASKGGAAKVKPLEWVEIEDYWEAKTPVGTYSVGFDDGWWAECDGPSMWGWNAPEDSRGYDGPSAAMIACKADCERRILSALEPAPDARQEAWRAGVEAASEVARDCIYHDSAGTGFDEDKFDAATRALVEKGPTDA